MPKNPGSKQENPTRKSGKPGPLGDWLPQVVDAEAGRMVRRWRP